MKGPYTEVAITFGNHIYTFQLWQHMAEVPDRELERLFQRIHVQVISHYIVGIGYKAAVWPRHM